MNSAGADLHKKKILCSTHSVDYWSHRMSATVLSPAAIRVSANVRAPKLEGSTSVPLLPPRFVELKKKIWKDSLIQSWREVLIALDKAVEEVTAKGTDVCVVFLQLRSQKQSQISC